jgi:hypothetical protein
MVARVAGNGLGPLNTSSNIAGGSGVLGQSAVGQRAGRTFVKAATANWSYRFTTRKLTSCISYAIELRAQLLEPMSGEARAACGRLRVD